MILNGGNLSLPRERRRYVKVLMRKTGNRWRRERAFRKRKANIGTHKLVGHLYSKTCLVLFQLFCFAYYWKVCCRIVSFTPHLTGKCLYWD